MGLREEYLALIFNVYFKKIGLTIGVVSQLEDIIKLQLRKDTLSEIVGSVFSQTIDNEKKLVLEVLHPKEMKEVETALNLFNKGDYSQIKVLQDFVHLGLKSHEEHYGKNLCLQAICEFFRIITEKPEKLESLTSKNKDFWYNEYHLFLRSFSHYCLTDMGIDKKGFIGNFHCHDSGNPPSKIDLDKNIKFNIPELVISATADYQESGVKLYLVHSGSYEILYEGLLKPRT